MRHGKTLYTRGGEIRHINLGGKRIKGSYENV
jgi:hypothetical protein